MGNIGHSNNPTSLEELETEEEVKTEESQDAKEPEIENEPVNQ